MTRGALAGAVVAMALISPADAAAEDAVGLPRAASAAPARLIVSPGSKAVLTKAPVRVAVRRPAGAKLTIHLGRRDVTRRFRAQAGGLVGRLTAGDGVRFGRNHLFVLAQRPGRRAQSSGRSFFLVRRSARLVRLKLGQGVPRRAQVEIALPRGSRARLAVVRRERRVRIWLNGRRVHQAASSSQGTRHTLALSATHGVRHGINRLRVSVVEPLAGRFAQVERRFVVRRTSPLANAGRDRAVRPRMRLRLGGTASTARGGILRHRWTLVRKPRGSRARLAGRTGSRPLLIPDRPGRYLVRQVVTEHERTRTGARAAQLGGAAIDEVGVTAAPQQTLVPISADTTGPTPRITVGETTYPLTLPPELRGQRLVQWLTLDRSTLQPVQTGNNWCCNESNTLDKIQKQLACDGSVGSSGLNQLMIISLPKNRQTLDADSEIATFNNSLLPALGVDPVDPAVLRDLNQSPVVIGIPCGGEGSGWVKLKGFLDAPFTLGWLMPDGSKEFPSGALRYRFQPERLAYDTYPPAPANTSRMTFNGKDADAPIASGQTGFHVVEVDPRDLSLVGNQVFSTSQISEMATFLEGVRANANYAAVQNIGFVNTSQPSDWKAVADALAALGGNPDTFYRVNGSYAFFGGPPLKRSEVLQSSSANIIDPTTSPPTIEPGTLSGRARIRHDGYYVPALPEPATADDSLYDVIFTPTTPWPYTFGAPADVAAYKKAMAYITENLDSLSDYAPDVRQAYLGNPDFRYADSRGDLRAIPYPGDDTTNCNRPSATPTSPDPGYTRAQFCNLRNELLLEFEWLDNTQALVDRFKEALGLSGGTQGLDLQTLGNNLTNAIKPPADEEIVAPILDLLEAIAEAGIAIFGGPEAFPIALGIAAAMTDIGVTGATTAEGAPLGDTVSAKVDDLAAEIGANIASASSSLDAIRSVAISDYGRLKALSDLWTSARGETVSDLATQLTIGAEGYFSTTLVPLAYDVWRLPAGEGPQTCYGGHLNAPFFSAPASSFVDFLDDFGVTRTRILNQTDSDAGYSPPATVTDPMFLPVSQSGYGLNKSTWFWSRGDPVYDGC